MEVKALNVVVLLRDVLFCSCCFLLQRGESCVSMLLKPSSLIGLMS